MVGDGAFSHKIDYIKKKIKILNLERHPNCINGSRDLSILLKGWILPIGGFALERVSTCGLRRRLVFKQIGLVQKSNEGILKPLGLLQKCNEGIC